VHEIAVESFKALLMQMIIGLEAKACCIEMCFPYFFNKAAPVSGVKSLLD
jgi:GTP cyclohydrolase IB